MLAAPDAIYPQFASHNAFTIAAVHELAGDARSTSSSACTAWARASTTRSWARPSSIARAASTRRSARTRRCSPTWCGGCSRTAPTARSSTGSSIRRSPSRRWSPTRSPSPRPAAAGRTAGIPLPIALLPGRRNSQGVDLADDRSSPRCEAALAQWDEPSRLRASCASRPAAAPAVSRIRASPSPAPFIRNPADRDDVVGTMVEATLADVATAVALAAERGAAWSATPAAERAACLERAAELMEAERVRASRARRARGGKDARERGGGSARGGRFPALLRGAGARRAGSARRLPRSARSSRISPWNFPLAIFVGEVGAALAAGNPVLAKPAEQTPLIAAAAVRILHRAGVPAGRAAAPARTRRDRRRGARRGSARGGRHLHRLDRGRAAHPPAARRAATTTRC